MGAAGSREQAWADLHDPSTTPERLAQIAAAHPEFAAAIAAHPRSYDALRTWAASARADATPAPAQATSPTVASAPVSGPPAKTGSWVSRHKPATALIAALTAVAVGVGGYFGIRALMPGDDQQAAPQETASTPPETVATAEPTTSESPAPVSSPETPAQIDLSELSLTAWADNGVWARSVRGGVELYDPRTASSRESVAEVGVTVPAPVATRERTEITDWAFTLAGRGDSLRVVFTYRVRTQADGLTPESFENRMSVIDPAGSAAAIDVSLSVTDVPDSDAHPSWSNVRDLAGSTGNVVFVRQASSWTTDAGTWAFSTQTGELLWSAAEYAAANTGGTVALWGETPSGGRCDALVLRDVASGEKITEYFSGKITGTFATEVCARNVAATSTGLYQVEQDGLSLLDPATGAVLMDFPQARTLITDPVGPYVFVHYDSSAPQGVSVWDTRTSRSVLDLGQTEVGRLDFALTTVFDGYLYFRNTDETPVIDLRSGEKVSATFSEMPLGAVGDVWVWLRDSSTRDERLAPFERGAWYGG